MKYDFDRIIDRKGTDCFKWDALKLRYGREDLISLWVADMDFAAPPQLIEALKERATHGVFGYSFRPDSYYRAIIDWMRDRHSWKVDRDWIVNTPGVVPALNFLVQCLTEPGDRIMIQTPVYDPFFAAVEDHGRMLVRSPLINQNNHYMMDFEDIEDKFKEGVKLFILCSPHNPVGRVWSHQELTRLADLCLHYDVLIIADEIHSDLVFPENRHVPFASLSPEAASLTISLNAPSKTFNIAGLFASYAIISNKEIREKFQSVLTKNHLYMGNIFSITALETAYRKCDDWLDQLIDYLLANYRYLVNFVRDNIPGLLVLQQEGTYLAWLDCRGFHLDHEKLIDLVLNDSRLALMDGRRYGEDGLHYLRLNFACPRSILARALERLKITFGDL